MGARRQPRNARTRPHFVSSGGVADRYMRRVSTTKDLRRAATWAAAAEEGLTASVGLRNFCFVIERACGEEFLTILRGIGAIIGLPLRGVAVLKVFIYKLMQHKGLALLRHALGRNRIAPTRAQAAMHMHMADGRGLPARGGPSYRCAHGGCEARARPIMIAIIYAAFGPNAPKQAQRHWSILSQKQLSP